MRATLEERSLDSDMGRYLPQFRIATAEIQSWLSIDPASAMTTTTPGALWRGPPPFINDEVLISGVEVHDHQVPKAGGISGP